MLPCNCGLNKSYSDCCGQYISGKKKPTTPEQLMRSRYTAYSKANISYIKKTMQGSALVGFNEINALLWAKSVAWQNLEVLNTFTELTTNQRGFVEFIATFSEHGEVKTMHEISEFHFIKGSWFYVDGRVMD